MKERRDDPYRATMRNPRKIALTFATHGIGLALGWFGWSHWRAAPVEEAPRPVPPKREAVRAVFTPDEVLEFARGPSGQEQDQRDHEKRMEEFDRLVATME